MKQILTSITAPCGVFKDTPDKIILYNNIEISFKSINKNSIELTISFEKTDYTKEQAGKLSREITKDFALIESFKNNLNFEWSGIAGTIWQVTENRHTIQKTLSSRYCVIRGAKLVTDLSNMPITETAYDNIKYIGTLEVYNNALGHMEKSGRDNEVAFWLWMTFESLQLALDKTEHELENLLTKNLIITEEELNTYKFSIGRFYRHKKNVDPNKTPYSIRKCAEITRKLIANTIFTNV